MPSATPAAADSSRLVRVFISSTFRDFQEERRLLVNEVFPELRRRARERFVEILEVDLRWGITQAEAERGETLPICLREIERSRPYFIGMLGERYGWVPERGSFAPAVIERHPWLEPHAGIASVTEIEMLHGVLNEPGMSDRALFYFRDPAFSGRRGRDYRSADAAERARLAALKDRIERAGCDLWRDYPSPRALAQRVLEDLWCRIDAEFPADQVPDATARVDRVHRAFMRGRAWPLAAVEGPMRGLQDAVRRARMTGDDTASGFILVSGDEGVGKTALVAAWLEGEASGQAPPIVFEHAVGSSSDAADPLRLQSRLIGWIEGVVGIGPGHDDRLASRDTTPPRLKALLRDRLGKLGEWLELHDAQAVIVLDGTEAIGAESHLPWLPDALPRRVVVVMTGTGDEARAAATLRGAEEIRLSPLDIDARIEVLRAYLERAMRRLDDAPMRRIASHPLGGLPAFLRIVIDELRCGSTHDTLQATLEALLASGTMAELVERRLQRVEGLCGEREVREALGGLAVSRAGLAEREVLGMHGLSPACWAAMRLQLEDLVRDSDGRIVLDTGAMREAVHRRYLSDPAQERAARRRLVVWWERWLRTVRSPGDSDEDTILTRALLELPWQFRRLQDGGGVVRALMLGLRRIGPAFPALVDDVDLREFSDDFERVRGESLASHYMRTVVGPMAWVVEGMRASERRWLRRVLVAPAWIVMGLLHLLPRAIGLDAKTPLNGFVLGLVLRSFDDQEVRTKIWNALRAPARVFRSLSGRGPADASMADGLERLYGRAIGVAGLDHALVFHAFDELADFHQQRGDASAEKRCRENARRCMRREPQAPSDGEPFSRADMAAYLWAQRRLRELRLGEGDSVGAQQVACEELQGVLALHLNGEDFDAAELDLETHETLIQACAAVLDPDQVGPAAFQDSSEESARMLHALTDVFDLDSDAWSEELRREGSSGWHLRRLMEAIRAGLHRLAQWHEARGQRSQASACRACEARCEALLSDPVAAKAAREADVAAAREALLLSQLEHGELSDQAFGAIESLRWALDCQLRDVAEADQPNEPERRRLLDELRQVLHQQRDLVSRAPGERHEDLPGVIEKLSEVAEQCGDADEANRLRLEAIHLLAPRMRDDGARALEACQSLVDLHVARGDVEAACDALEHLIRIPRLEVLEGPAPWGWRSRLDLLLSCRRVPIAMQWMRLMRRWWWARWTAPMDPADVDCDVLSLREFLRRSGDLPLDPSESEWLHGTEAWLEQRTSMRLAARHDGSSDHKAIAETWSALAVRFDVHGLSVRARACRARAAGSRAR